MDVKLTLDGRLEEETRRLLSDGRFGSVDDLVKEALSQLIIGEGMAAEAVTPAEIDKLLESSEEDVTAGHVVEAEAMFDRLLAKYTTKTTTPDE